MSKLVQFFVLLLCSLSVLHAELKQVVFVPQWVPQTQFAGYYAAKELGFFEQEGLDVSFRHIGVNSKEPPLDYLLKGKAQIVGMQLPQAIVARSKGAPILNVCQITQMSGLWVVARKPLLELKDLNHLHIAKWAIGYNELCDLLCHEYNLDVEWVHFNRDVNLFIYRAVDATLCFSYSEYIRLLLAVGHIPQENVLRFYDHGFKSPDDGLYVTEDYYRDNKETVDAFIRAAKRGWDYAAEHPEESCKLSRKFIEAAHVSTNRILEKLMLEEYLRLQVNPTTGLRDYATVTHEVFEELVQSMYRAAVIPRIVPYDEMIRHD